MNCSVRLHNSQFTLSRKARDPPGYFSMKTRNLNLPVFQPGVALKIVEHKSKIINFTPFMVEWLEMVENLRQKLRPGRDSAGGKQERCGALGKMGGKALLIDIDADTNHDEMRTVRLRLHFAENARQLPAIGINIVRPLDSGQQLRKKLTKSAVHRHGNKQGQLRNTMKRNKRTKHKGA